MNTLPQHGRIVCSRCFPEQGPLQFDTTKRTCESWRITANPLAWGAQEPEIVVLGFSKGPTQSGALANTPHNEIAYKGGRTSVGKILAHVGLLNASSSDLSSQVSAAIADRAGRFHFASLIRCTVERFDTTRGEWLGTGGGMLDKFVATPFGQEVTGNCTSQFLSRLPASTKLVIMFGLGSGLNYVRACHRLFVQAPRRPVALGQ